MNQEAACSDFQTELKNNLTSIQERTTFLLQERKVLIGLVNKIPKSPIGVWKIIDIKAIF